MSLRLQNPRLQSNWPGFRLKYVPATPPEKTARLISVCARLAEDLLEILAAKLQVRMINDVFGMALYKPRKSLRPEVAFAEVVFSRIFAPLFLPSDVVSGLGDFP